MEEQAKREMDLVDLLCVAGRWFKHLFSAIGGFLAVMLRLAWKRKLILCILSILVFAGVCAYHVKKNSVMKFIAESQMLIMVSDAYLVNDMLNGLDYMCVMGQCSQVAKKLNMSEEDASAVKSIHSYFWTDERHDYSPTRVDYQQSYLRDTSIMRMSDRLQIEIEVSDMKILSKLTDGLRYYINEANYTGTRRERNVRKLETMVAEFDKQAAVLDSLKHIEYFVNGTPKVQIDGPMIVSSKDKQLYHDQILALRTQAENLRIDIEKQKECVAFTHDFVLKKGSFQMLKSAVIITVVFFVLMTFVLYLIERRKEILNFLEMEED